MSSNVNTEILPTSTLTISPRDEADHLPPQTPLTEKVDHRNTIAQHQSEIGPLVEDAHQSVGLSVIEQSTTIPLTGEQMTTTTKEYWLYIFYCTSHREQPGTCSGR